MVLTGAARLAFEDRVVEMLPRPAIGGTTIVLYSHCIGVFFYFKGQFFWPSLVRQVA